MGLHVLISYNYTGLGNGARVAAVVGTRCRGTLAGFLFLSYPAKVGTVQAPGIFDNHLSAIDAA